MLSRMLSISLRRNLAAGWSSPPGRRAARSPRCGCRSWRARAGGTGRYRCWGRNPARATAPAERRDRQTPRKHRDEQRAPVDQRGEQELVAVAKPLESALRKPAESSTNGLREGPAGGRAACSRYMRQSRNQRARENIRGQHGEDHRFRQRHEQVAGHAAQEEHRQEHDADAERRDQRGNGDLGCAFEDRVVTACALFEVALDVLDGRRWRRPPGCRRRAPGRRAS